MHITASLLEPQLTTLSPWLLYLVVWGFVFVESGLLVGFFLPGDSVIFAAGLIAGGTDSPINIVVLLVGLFIAAFLGDQVGYVLGRHLGRPWIEKKERPTWNAGLARAEAFYNRLGWLAVIVARFIPWLRTFVPFAAGVAKMNYYQFLVTNAIGALLWAVGITAMGYYAATLPVVKGIAYSIAGFFIIGSLVYMVIVGVRAWLRHRHATSEGSLDA